MSVKRIEKSQKFGYSVVLEEHERVEISTKLFSAIMPITFLTYRQGI